MFKLGQVILYKNGPNIISKAIRLIEGNRITHCAVVIVEDETNPTLLEIENLTTRVRLVKLNDTLHYTDEIYIATNKQLKFPPQNNITPWIASQLVSRKYSAKALVNSLINHFLGRFIKDYVYKEYFKVTHKYTCASLVGEVLEYTSNFNCMNSSLLEPDDFTISPWELTRYK